MPRKSRYNQLNNRLNVDPELYKKISSLKKYCPKAYKYLIFHLSKEKVNGIYTKDLPTSNEFKFVYGQIKITYEIKNKLIHYLELEPSQFFIDGHKIELDVYKNIPYRNDRDKFKIDLMHQMNN